VVLESSADVAVPLVGHVCLSLNELAISLEGATTTIVTTAAAASSAAAAAAAASGCKKKSAFAVCMSTKVFEARSSVCACGV